MRSYRVVGKNYRYHYTDIEISLFQFLTIEVNMDKLEHDFITTEEACIFLGIKKPTLYNKISAGIIPVYKVAGGHNNRYRIRDLEKLFVKR